MKQIAIVLVVIIATLIACEYYFWPNRSANRKDIDDLRTQLNERIDSLDRQLTRISADVDTIKTTQQTILTNQDTLKKSQAIIFDEVKKDNGSSIWDFFGL